MVYDNGSKRADIAYSLSDIISDLGLFCGSSANLNRGRQDRDKVSLTECVLFGESLLTVLI